MGSTGAGILKHSRRGDVNDSTFGILGASVFSGRVGHESGLEAVGNGKITLRIDTDDKQDIIFQFKLVRDGKMSIRAYDPNVPSKGHVAVVSSSPSLDDVIKHGDATERANAQKIREMMNKSYKIDESQLTAIANKLKSAKGGN